MKLGKTMGELYTSIRVNNRRYKIKPVERKLCLGERSYTLRQVLNRKGGLIIGEGDTGKSTYVSMLAARAEKLGYSTSLIKLRTREKIEIPKVDAGGVCCRYGGIHRLSSHRNCLDTA